MDLLQITRAVLVRRYILWLVGKCGENIPLTGIQVVSFVVYRTALSLKQTVYRRMVGGWIIDDTLGTGIPRGQIVLLVQL